MLTNKHFKGKKYKEKRNSNIASYYYFLKFIMRRDSKAVYEKDSWLKMKESSGFPMEDENFFPSLIFDVDDYSANVSRELGFMNKVIDEALEFYLSEHKSSNHKFSWENN